MSPKPCVRSIGSHNCQRLTIILINIGCVDLLLSVNHFQSLREPCTWQIIYWGIFPVDLLLDLDPSLSANALACCLSVRGPCNGSSHYNPLQGNGEKCVDPVLPPTLFGTFADQYGNSCNVHLGGIFLPIRLCTGLPTANSLETYQIHQLKKQYSEIWNDASWMCFRELVFDLDSSIFWLLLSHTNCMRSISRTLHETCPS